MDWKKLVASPEDPDTVWYRCSCHCGATEFKIRHAPLEASSSSPQREPAPVIKCNCSICVKNGYLLIYATRDHVEPVRGWDELRDYRFASKTWDHKFCGACGSSVGIDFLGIHPAGDIIAVNARLLQDVDVDKLNLQPVNGRGFQTEHNAKHRHRKNIVVDTGDLSAPYALVRLDSN